MGRDLTQLLSLFPSFIPLLESVPYQIQIKRHTITRLHLIAIIAPNQLSCQAAAVTEDHLFKERTNSGLTRIATLQSLINRD
ncbi:hypothetical protein F5148DRAFT_1237557 [Russula earlei]|uniref:Uncharacterized protein n=1 Tax=Russula earlei TaxID=71964 RepID=A0ACC0TWP4_9AGAM|nr:hypothetical protein F5148DRAFT_1237557 [Russula earlei]